MSVGFLRNMVLHRKLMAMLLMTSGAALLLAALASTVYQYVQFRAELVANVASDAALMLSNTRPSVSFEDPADARDMMTTFATSPGIRIACLYRRSGQLFASYSRDKEEPPCPSSPPPIGQRFSATRLELVQRDVVEGKPTEWLLVRSDVEAMVARLRTQAAITAVVFFAAFMFAYWMSSYLQRFVSEPIVELAGVAQRVSQTGDYSERAVKRSEDEIGTLAESFNSMLERITLAEADREGALARERDANRAKDEFLATLSHELRSPLSAILGWTHLLRAAPATPADLERGLQRIERSAQAQNRLINDLLDVSRILSGKLSLHQQAADLVTVARASIDSFTPLANSRGIALHALFDEDRLPALVDADRISQVIGNLLSNALAFTPAGGSVEVSLRNIGAMQELAVADTGQGIPAEFLPRAFEPFRQADASHTRKHGGLGLGLAIVKRITEMHGGDVSVKSGGLGEGATFIVRLPAATETMRTSIAPAADVVPQETPNLEGCLVLVVDDDQDTRELVSAALSSAHARTTIASSAEEAIAAAMKASPDVLITDIAMPGTDGYTLKRRLEQVLGDRMPRVTIALSAFAAEADSRRSMDLGFDAHITKPFDPVLLLATIQSRLAMRGASANG